MCKCEYASSLPNGAYRCGRFNLYGWSGPLNICTLTAIQESWAQRMDQVPRLVKERERGYLDSIYLTKGVR